MLNADARGIAAAPPRRRRSAPRLPRHLLRGLLPALLTAGCATMPPREWPPFDERTVVATYTTRGQPVQVPLAHADLTILEFAVEPAPEREEFRGGRRWLHPQPGVERLVVRCRYRAYGSADRPPAPPEEVFRGAASLDVGPPRDAGGPPPRPDGR